MAGEAVRCECGEIRQPLSIGLQDRFQKDEAKDFLEKTWGELGLPEQDVVTASAGERELHFLFA